jgi:hypothetical protein
MNVMKSHYPYLPPSKVVKLRIFREPLGHDQHRWCVEVVLSGRNYTEECWAFDTYTEAVTYLRDFAAEVAPHLLVVR